MRQLKDTCIRSLQKTEKAYQACLNWNENNPNSWVLTDFCHTDSKPALEACNSSDTHRNCPESRQLSYRLLLVNQICVSLWLSIKTPALPLIICRMPKDVFQENPKPNPHYFIMAAAAAAATEICEQ